MLLSDEFATVGFVDSSDDDILTQTFNLKPGLYHFSAISPTSSELDLALSVSSRSGRLLAVSDDRLGSFDPGLTFEVKRKGKFNVNLSISSKSDISDFGDLEFVFKAYYLDKIVSPSPEYTWIADPLTGLDDAEIKSDFDAILSDGVATKSELEGLLRSAGSSDGLVTQKEFDDLRTISYNLGDYLSSDTAEYYQQIFDNVVLGNPANSFWTGGSTARSQLGNLSIGSSSELMDKLVDKWFLGLDLPNPTMGGDAARNQEDSIGIYRIANGPLFGDAISYTDVNQGVLGDCWFLAAAASVASFNPDRIRDVFIDNGDGTYGVAFNEINPNHESEGSKQHWVTVDLQLPTRTTATGEIRLAAAAGSSTHALDGILWPALLEKGAAQASEIGIFANARPAQTANSYFSIDGGFDEGLAILEPTSLFTATAVDPQITADDPFRSEVVSSARKWNDFVSQYDAIYNSGGGSGIAMSLLGLDASFNPWVSAELSGALTMVAGHALGLVGYDSDSSTFTIYNPWGLGAILNPTEPAVVPFDITSKQAYKNWLNPSGKKNLPSGFSVAT